ncbi:Serine--tRNA ligase [Marinicrinis lubricantis]
MLDIEWIRNHPQVIERTAEQKGIKLSARELLDCDAQRRRLLQKTEQLRARRNAQTKEISDLMRQGRHEDAKQRREQVKQHNELLGVLDAELSEVETRLRQLMLGVPNPVSPDTPIGRSDADNVEVRRTGSPPAFTFQPKDHVELAVHLDMIDIPRGVKVAGTRSYYLKNTGMQLHRAVQQLALDVLAGQGFTLLDVPVMVRGEALEHTGFFPSGEDQTFKIADEDKWLVGTSEVSLVSYFSGEIVDAVQPVKLAALSNCFRKEVGSAGRDVRGLYRVHQFSKVEQVIICKNDLALSEQLLGEITGHAEHILQLLELPYRVMAVCTGDMSQKTYKQYDIETGCRAEVIMERPIHPRMCWTSKRAAHKFAGEMKTESFSIATP